MNRLLLLALLLALAAGAAPAQAQATATLQGLVTDGQGDPLPGAQVVVVGTGRGAATNAAGRYTIAGVPAGSYTVRASFVGYTPAEAAVTLRAGETRTQDFALALDAVALGDVVVTGVVNPVARLESSVSISTLTPAALAQTAPRTTAEIFRTIPGVRAEASGGDGNTNISVRGVPISAGGSKYLQLQEDGLPLFLFGDIAFATADIFLRADPTVARVEAVRGGGASTLASNSPAGIINFISQTGDTPGGSLATTAGLDYGQSRLDFAYGGPVGENVAFHVGGFYRTGTGTRHTGYLAEQGGQVRANLTRRFPTGYARLHAKLLDDRTPAYLPMPVEVTGTNDNPTWRSAEGFSATRGTPHSVYLQSNFGLGADGQRRRVDLADGMHPRQRALGAEFAFDLGDGWAVDSRARVALNSGRFVAPFTAAVGERAAILAAVGSQTGRNLAGATLTRADDGQPFTGTLVQSIVLFDTELKNFNTAFNDLRVSRRFGARERGAGEATGGATLTAGLFSGVQRINMAWLWNSYLMEVAGENASLLDITTAGGTRVSTGGLFAYGAAPFGNCCAVLFNSTYNVAAPYAALAYQPTPQLNLDASVRYDRGRVTGVGSGGIVAPVDVNQNGTIEPWEQAVNLIDQTQRNPVDYTYDYVSLSAGAGYRLSGTQAVFARASRGAAAKADRAIFPTGRYVDPIEFGPRDFITQAELGYKQRFGGGEFSATGFFASTTEEGGFEATTQQIIENDYDAFGAEVEGAVVLAGGFGVRGALTATRARISSGENEGNVPRRQPALLFSLLPTYEAGPFSVGLGVIGQSRSYAQDNNALVMPGFALLSGFASAEVAPGLSFSLNANNLLDQIGITESEEGAIVDNQVNYVRARSVTGRTVSASLRYTF